MAFKRKRIYAPRRSSGKRRRMFRRRFKRRSRNSYGTTSRSLNASTPFQIRSRKLRRKTYRHRLFESTRFKTHYRTVLAFSDAIATPNNTTTEQIFVTPALSSAVGSEFWHTVGGLQDPSFGEIPSFAGAGSANDPVSIVLRGGRLWCTVSLGLGAVDNVKCRIQMAWPKAQNRTYDDTANNNTLGIPGAATGYLGSAGLNISGPGYLGASRPASWDMVAAPDYEQYFYPPVVDKTIDLKAGDDYTLYYKVKPIKLDCGPFKDSSGWYPYYFVSVYQNNNSNALSETVSVITGHNMSFAVADTLT